MSTARPFTGKDFSSTSEVPIYNFVSSVENSITWHEFMVLNQFYGVKVPPVKSLWYHTFWFARSRWSYKIQTFFVHFLFGVILDVLMLCIWKKPRLVRMTSVRKEWISSNFKLRIFTKNFIFSLLSMEILWSSKCVFLVNNFFTLYTERFNFKFTLNPIHVNRKPDST